MYNVNLPVQKCLTHNTAFHNGSILGPLLFIIYINDFPNASKVFQFIMYADDTTLSCCVDTIQANNIDEVINFELRKVNNWLLT